MQLPPQVDLSGSIVAVLQEASGATAAHFSAQATLSLFTPPLGFCAWPLLPFWGRVFGIYILMVGSLSHTLGQMSSYSGRFRHSVPLLLEISIVRTLNSGFWAGGEHN